MGSNKNHASNLLKPRDASLLNSDYWPEFELKSAHIYDPTDPTAKPVNLLHAGLYRPLTIIARLQPPNDRNAHAWLKDPNLRPVDIVLQDVKEFSYGQYGDGTLDIWAAGHAGWFTIRPSKAYRDTYRDMVQAVKLLYFTADTYKSVRKYSDLSPEAFFQKVCDDRFDKCTSTEDAEAMFAKHRLFLMASMLTAKEGLQWHRVPLFSHFQNTYPQDFDLVKQRIGFKPKPASRKASTQSPAPSNSSSRRKKAPAKQQSTTPRSAVAKRTTRSTRSQSLLTATESVLNLDTVPDEPIEVEDAISTPNPGRGQEMASSDSSSDKEDLRPHGKGKGKSVLRPKPAKFISPNATDKPSPTNHPAEHMPPPDDQEDVDMDSSEHPESVQGDQFTPSIPFRLQEAEENGDMWACPVDGCMHKVYAASEPSSQVLIGAHRQMHDYDDDERIQLVRRMEAPWLPVNRLMDRVRGLAAQAKFPPAVVQRY